MDIDFRALGPLEVRDGAVALDAGSPKQRTVLALLLVRANQLVTTARLVDELWPDHPPNSALANVSTYVSRLRRVLAPTGCVLAAHDAGYRLAVSPESIDLIRCLELARRGEAAWAAGDAGAAAGHWRAAIGLWRGEPFEGVSGGPVLGAARAEWNERRLALTERYATAQLCAGPDSDVVAELRRYTDLEPLRESGWRLLVAAVYLGGNRAAALDIFERARTALAEQLGIEPGTELLALRRAILRHDTAAVRAGLAGPGQPDPVGTSPTNGARPIVPAQLPGDVWAFTGRANELASLDAMMTPGGEQPTAVVISAVSGTAGVGKTALAVRWAHRVASSFPDGQLYVDLRGYDPGQPMAPADALARFLTALGVADHDIPLETDERAARYRTATAGRRLLVVLDNAASVEQVRPLLPGTISCTVVVTSRNSLAGLVAVHGARRLDLDRLPLPDAVALLRRLIGARVDAEPGPAATIAGQCARLPLALRVAAELAVGRPSTTLAELANDLTDQQRRLDLLDADGDPRAAVAAVLSWSVQHLPAEAARTFRLLGLHPGPDLDPYAAAALADTGLQRSRHTLDLLARAHLVHSTNADRYGQHDLLRAYAASLAAKDTDTDPRAASGRLFDYYLSVASAAMDALHPAEADRRPRISPAKTPTPTLADREAARVWLDTERPALAAMAAHTVANGWPDHTVRLSTTLHRYLDGGHPIDATAIHTHARQAARQTGDRTAEAQTLLGLATAHMRLGRYGPAAGYLQEALALFRQVGDRVGEARTLTNLGNVGARLGRYRSAADHYQQGMELFRKAGDRTGEARALGNLGMVEERLGRYRPAADHLRRSLALCREAGDQTGEAQALDNLGIVEQRLGRPGPAARHHEQALATFRQLGNQSGEAWALDNLGSIHTRLGRTEQAVQHHRQALKVFRDVDDRDGETWALNGLGEAAQAANRPADALPLHAGALAIATDVGARDQQARAHAGLGHAHGALGDHARARLHLQHALTLYRDLESPDADYVLDLLVALDP
jgi:DNA-binding SARP family transcriptional activator/Tfp pilus assembly protein PilF